MRTWPQWTFTWTYTIDLRAGRPLSGIVCGSIVLCQRQSRQETAEGIIRGKKVSPSFRYALDFLLLPPSHTFPSVTEDQCTASVILKGQKNALKHTLWGYRQKLLGYFARTIITTPLTLHQLFRTPLCRVQGIVGWGLRRSRSVFGSSHL